MKSKIFYSKTTEYLFYFVVFFFKHHLNLYSYAINNLFFPQNTHSKSKLLKNFHFYF